MRGVFGMEEHDHKSTETREEGFICPVTWPENRLAHGGICRVETCSCGAVRRINVNHQHEEYGPWV